ncbi:MAG: hypothetical protein J2O47_01815, partial [Acidimicrobiaceae bacterium]|nr:hypothetical protein [Acidimicrobiaceae bacterium]
MTTTSSTLDATSSPGATAPRRVRGHGGRRIRRLLLGLAALGLAMTVLAGCGGAAGAFVRADRSLLDAGFHSPNVNISTSSFSTNSASSIRVNASLGAPPTEADFRQVARIIWNDVHYRFDALDISLSGGGTSSSATYTFDQLEQTFGARPAAWNRTTLTHSLITLGIVVLVIAAVVILAVVLLIIFLVNRRRRRRASLAASGGAGWPGSFGATAPPPPG